MHLRKVSRKKDRRWHSSQREIERERVYKHRDFIALSGRARRAFFPTPSPNRCIIRMHARVRLSLRGGPWTYRPRSRASNWSDILVGEMRDSIQMRLVARFGEEFSEVERASIIL